MADLAKPSRTVRTKVLECVKACKCLVCDAEAGPRRGLCARHYQMYRQEFLSMSKKRRAEFEMTQIKRGKILSPHQICDIKRESPFTA
jgi:hypothetical protein